MTFAARWTYYSCITFTAIGWLAMSQSTHAADFKPVAVVNDESLTEIKQPQAAVDPRGNVAVAFGAKNTLYCAVSTDGGKSFAEPVSIARIGALALGMRRGPRIAATGNGLFTVTAIGGEMGGGKDGDVLAWHSADNGRSWQGPVQVNDEPASAREGLHAMASGPKGELFCVWLDLRHKRTELFGSTSTDGGQTWSKNRLIYQSPEKNICECCHPSVAFDRAGGLYVMWRNSLDGNRDMYTLYSSNGGKTFNQAAKLGNGTWQLGACPMDGGAIAPAGKGAMSSIWRREKTIYLATPGKPEKSLGPGEQPWAVGTPQGAYFAWVSKRYGDLWLSTPETSSPSKVASSVNDPVLAAPAGGAGPVILVWEQGPRNASRIFAQVVGQVTGK